MTRENLNVALGRVCRANDFTQKLTREETKGVAILFRRKLQTPMIAKDIFQKDYVLPKVKLAID